MTMQESLLEENKDFAPFDNEPKSENTLFFLLGNASLLAFNIIINAVDIYNSLTGVGTGQIATLLNRAYNIPCSITALLLCFIKPKNLKLTLISALSIIMILMCILPIFMLVDMSEKIILWGSVVTIGIIGVLSSILFSSTFSFAAQYKSDAVAYVSSGNGLCGVIAAAMRILTKAIKDTVEINAVYFFLAAVIFLATLIYFIIKAKNPDLSRRLFVVETAEDKKKGGNTMKVIKAIWPQWLSVFFNFCITLSLFPGYIVSCDAGKLGSWSAITITTIFCVFDWVGRSIPSYVKPFVSLKFSWIPIACRLLFYLIFMLSIQEIVELGDPWWTCSWDVVFALTNGYFGTICMVYGNTHPDLTEVDDKRFAGFLMPFAVNAGILAAMLVTFAMPAK